MIKNRRLIQDIHTYYCKYPVKKPRLFQFVSTAAFAIPPAPILKNIPMMRIFFISRNTALYKIFTILANILYKNRGCFNSSVCHPPCTNYKNFSHDVISLISQKNDAQKRHPVMTLPLTVHKKINILWWPSLPAIQCVSPRFPLLAKRNITCMHFKHQSKKTKTPQKPIVVPVRVQTRILVPEQLFSYHYPD